MIIKTMSFLNVFSFLFGTLFSQTEIFQSFYLRALKQIRELDQNPQDFDEHLSPILIVLAGHESFDLSVDIFHTFLQSPNLGGHL